MVTIYQLPSDSAIDDEAKNDDNKTRATVQGNGASERILALCDNC